MCGNAKKQRGTAANVVGNFSRVLFLFCLSGSCTLE